MTCSAKPLLPAPTFVSDDGVIDSLRFLLFSENYCKPWSAEFVLTALLTACF
jgi:hypothetical protein